MFSTSLRILFSNCNLQTGELQTNSALNLIVFGTKLEHLDLIEYVIVDLLKVKWESFIRRTFYRQFITFTMFFLVSTAVFTLRPNMETSASWACTNSTNFTDIANVTNLTDQERVFRDQLPFQD